MTEVRDEDNAWIVWGDEVDPIVTDLSKEDAEAKLTELKASGRTDVFAENNETGESIE